MDHFKERKTILPNRFGLYYLPDFEHYSEKDAKFWLPKLKDIDAGWLVLKAPGNRAISQVFIEQIASAGINMILDFDLPLGTTQSLSDLSLLMPLYAKWGVRYAIPYRFPNIKTAWNAQDWSNPDLIGQFSNLFQQFALLSFECGIRAIFPPLMPGGDYWDLAFLKNFLNYYQKYSSPELFDQLIISSLAWDWGKPLDWGQGGQKSWPKAKPFQTKSNTQNQIGFRAYEWYAQTAFEATGKKIPIMLFEAGVSQSLGTANSATHLNSTSIEKMLAIYQLIKDQNVFPSDPNQIMVNPVGPEITACLFYCLSKGHVETNTFEWFDENGQKTPVAQAVSVINAERNNVETKEVRANHTIKFKNKRYILIDCGLKKETRKFLELLQPYIKKYQPIIGFSEEEALSSAVVLAITSKNEDSPNHSNFTSQFKGLLKVIHPGEIQSFIRECIYD